MIYVYMYKTTVIILVRKRLGRNNTIYFTPLINMLQLGTSI